MKLFCVCLVAGLLPASGQPRDSSGAPILLYTEFEGAPSPKALDAIHEELDSIMAPMGLEFAWRDLAGDHDETSSRLAVVHFRGRCDADSMRDPSTHSIALGWTHVSDGVILPFSDVDCDRVHAFIRNGTLELSSDERETVFGRAIARVLAHELYHIFANTPLHGASGVGKAVYSVQELLSPRFRFREPESRALRGGKEPEHRKSVPDEALAVVR